MSLRPSLRTVVMAAIAALASCSIHETAATGASLEESRRGRAGPRDPHRHQHGGGNGEHDHPRRDAGVPRDSGCDAPKTGCLEGTEPTQWFGRDVSIGPDLDGDGLGDLVVGGAGALDLVGVVRVYSGSTRTLIYELATGIPNDDFGTSVSLGPDIDGDGRGDIAVGANQADVTAGRVYVYSGATGTPLYELAGEFADDRFGVAVVIGPDADGDGLGDLIVGASRYANSGRAYLFSGATGSLLHVWDAEQYDNVFGNSVSLGPDADGDGRGDVVIGAAWHDSRTGRAYLHSGATYALLRQWDGEMEGDDFGSWVSLGPDVDGDGLGDVAVGANQATRSALATVGRAYLFSGAIGGPLGAWTGAGAGDHFGTRVWLGPDANGDGRGDLLIGALFGGTIDQGSVELHSGLTGGMLSMWLGETPGDQLGVAALGPDIDGDGLGDVATGAFMADGAGGEEVGRACVYRSTTGFRQ